jgi:hypothetical protein
MHATRIFPALAGAALAACSGAARVEVGPASLQLWEPGQSARVRAVPLASSGKALPDRICAWSSADPAVATVAAAGNEATVTAAGAGSTAVRCRVGGATGEVAVTVRLIARLEVEPDPALLRLLDAPQPTTLAVRAFDQAGQPATPRRLLTRCLDESVCRGDDRGQLWPVGPGSTRAVVEADGRRVEVAARVEDARTAAGKPRAVKDNPMLEYEKAVEIIQREQKKAAEKKR